ncbi:MAG: hypothetical protein PHY15_06780 [Eubacteriales bacterium]|nr:hypothetical protein [Eubacteriales bacterium]
MKKSVKRRLEKKTAEVERLVRKILENETSLTKVDNGYYEGEIYVDYRDELEDSTIRKIFKNDNPREAFDNIMDEILFEADIYEDEEIMSVILKHLPDGMYETYYQFILDFVSTYVSYAVPEDHYLAKQVEIDILLDAGDANYDYSLNAVYPCYCGSYDEDILDEAGIVWLAESQGYSKEQLKAALYESECGDSRFLKSLRNEVLNTTTSLNAVTFFANMTLGECLTLNEKVAAGENVLIPAGTPCGLYDPWNGAGSILEIELEKDIVLPAKNIDSILPDGTRGYSVSEIYGMCLSFWRVSKKISAAAA